VSSEYYCRLYVNVTTLYTATANANVYDKLLHVDDKDSREITIVVWCHGRRENHLNSTY